jgi:hypothetical protein
MGIRTVKNPINLAREMLKTGAYETNLLICIGCGNIQREQLSEILNQISDLSNYDNRYFHRNASFFFLLQSLREANYVGGEWVGYDQMQIERAYQFFDEYLPKRLRIELSGRLAIHLSSRLREFVWALGDCRQDVPRDTLEIYAEAVTFWMKKSCQLGYHRGSLIMAVSSYLKAVETGSPTLYDLAMGHLRCYEEESRMVA